MFRVKNSGDYIGTFNGSINELPERRDTWKKSYPGHLPTEFFRAISCDDLSVSLQILGESHDNKPIGVSPRQYIAFAANEILHKKENRVVQAGDIDAEWVYSNIETPDVFRCKPIHYRVFMFDSRKEAEDWCEYHSAFLDFVHNSQL